MANIRLWASPGASATYFRLEASLTNHTLTRGSPLDVGDLAGIDMVIVDGRFLIEAYYGVPANLLAFVAAGGILICQSWSASPTNEFLPLAVRTLFADKEWPYYAQLPATLTAASASPLLNGMSFPVNTTTEWTERATLDAGSEALLYLSCPAYGVTNSPVLASKPYGTNGGVIYNSAIRLFSDIQPSLLIDPIINNILAYATDTNAPTCLSLTLPASVLV